MPKHSLAQGASVAFVPRGTSLEASPGVLALDVGNNLCPGIIDHHQPGSPTACAAELVVRHPDFVLNSKAIETTDDFLLITHFEPDLDALTSTFLSLKLINEGQFPRHADVLARYTGDIDQGITFRKPNFVATLYGVFTVMCEKIGKLALADKWTREERSLEFLRAGFELLEFVCTRIKESTDLHSARIFVDHPDFADYVERFAQDRAAYARDLEKADLKCLTLPQKDGGTFKSNALFIRDPESLFLRHWARFDNSNPDYPSGFSLLVVSYDDQRFIISIPIDSRATLKGLGLILEEMETERRIELHLERKGRARTGYDTSDPWYDGRNPLHNFSIVDTPMNGTVLTRKEIFSAVETFGKAGRNT